MPRTPRIAPGGYVYHVMNRANGRLRIFRKAADYVAFERILAEAGHRFDMRITGYCIMGNHWHLLLWPRADGDLPAFMRWATQTHVQRFHTAHGTVGIGHLYRGRYKSFPVQSDAHYLTVLRYIETNPLRAALVARAAQWPFSSLALRRGRKAPFAIVPGPIELPDDWQALVEQHVPEPQQAAIARSIERGIPFGDVAWTQITAARLALQSTITPKGRPRK